MYQPLQEVKDLIKGGDGCRDHRKGGEAETSGKEVRPPYYMKTLEYLSGPRSVASRFFKPDRIQMTGQERRFYRPMRSF